MSFRPTAFPINLLMIGAPKASAMNLHSTYAISLLCICSASRSISMPVTRTRSVTLNCICLNKSATKSSKYLPRSVSFQVDGTKMRILLFMCVYRPVFGSEYMIEADRITVRMQLMVLLKNSTIKQLTLNCRMNLGMEQEAWHFCLQVCYPSQIAAFNARPSCSNQIPCGGAKRPVRFQNLTGLEYATSGAGRYLTSAARMKARVKHENPYAARSMRHLRPGVLRSATLPRDGTAHHRGGNGSLLPLFRCFSERGKVEDFGCFCRSREGGKDAPFHHSLHSMLYSRAATQIPCGG